MPLLFYRASDSTHLETKLLEVVSARAVLKMPSSFGRHAPGPGRPCHWALGGRGLATSIGTMAGTGSRASRCIESLNAAVDSDPGPGPDSDSKARRPLARLPVGRVAPPYAATQRPSAVIKVRKGGCILHRRDHSPACCSFGHVRSVSSESPTQSRTVFRLALMVLDFGRVINLKPYLT